LNIYAIECALPYLPVSLRLILIVKDSLFGNGSERNLSFQKYRGPESATK